jgi:Zn finger protein HypA/HybF involved in hydrogenase expression
MHDYHAVSVLIRDLFTHPAAGDIDEVLVRASPVFSPESLQQAYEMQTIDTPLAGSRLLVEEAVDERTCDGCRTVWRLSSDDVAGHVVVCPSCGAMTPIGENVGLELLEVRAGAVTVT